MRFARSACLVNLTIQRVVLLTAARGSQSLATHGWQMARTQQAVCNMLWLCPVTARSMHVAGSMLQAAPVPMHSA